MSTLALLGGEPALSDTMRQVSAPVVNADGQRLVNELLDREEITQSPIVADFEAAWADYTGAAYSLAVNSGTSALIAGLYGVGIRPGDEVLVPSYTYWATATVPFAHDAKPVFYDVEPDSWLIDVADAERRITSRTRAIIIVHVWGAVCDMDAVMAMARRHKLAVIEDCSHAHGARWREAHVGLLGDVGCFSLQGSKVLPGGEAGILITKTRDVYERALALGFYERLPHLPEDSSYRRFWLTGMGIKLRPHPLAIALAQSRLVTLDELSERRNRQGATLEALLAGLDWLQPQRPHPDGQRVYSYHYMRYRPEVLGGLKLDTLLRAVSAEGLVSGFCGYGRLHRAPLFLEGGPYRDGSEPTEAVSLPVTEALGASTFFAAPRFEIDCMETVERYAMVYHRIAEHVDALLAWEREHGTEPRQDVRRRVSSWSKISDQRLPENLGMQAEYLQNR